MQIKIVIGTIAFMLTMIVFGYAALREPARLEEWAAASEARQIEQGAAVYHSNCASCHGENGRAEECYGPDGELTGCAGLPLARAELLCLTEGTSPRMDERNWEGTLESFIGSTVAAGRSVNGMPTWGAEYGGPLEAYQVENVTKFIVNWRTEAMCSLPTPTPVPWPATVGELANQVTPDPAAGQQLYEITYGCSACHGKLDDPGSNAVGPWAGDFADVGATRVDGYTAADYMYESILLPSAYIAPDCPTGPCAGPPSGMPANFGTRMSLQDMADVIAYLLGSSDLQGDAVVEYP